MKFCIKLAALSNEQQKIARRKMFDESKKNHASLIKTARRTFNS